MQHHRTNQRQPSGGDRGHGISVFRQLASQSRHVEHRGPHIWAGPIRMADRVHVVRDLHGITDRKRARRTMAIKDMEGTMHQHRHAMDRRRSNTRPDRSRSPSTTKTKGSHQDAEPDDREQPQNHPAIDPRKDNEVVSSIHQGQLEISRLRRQGKSATSGSSHPSSNTGAR